MQPGSLAGSLHYVRHCGNTDRLNVIVILPDGLHVRDRTNPDEWKRRIRHPAILHRLPVPTGSDDNVCRLF